MKPLSRIKTSYLILALFLVWAPTSAWSVDAVASFGQVSGTVQVIRETRKIPARTGLILNDQDVVVTGKDSRATIIFRDGSEIRLFQDTQFIIEKSEETKKGSRRFLHDFKLKVGSFWGKFLPGKQTTKISTPTATIGIKGTSMVMSQGNDKLDLSLSSGLISVQNEDEEMDLKPGNRIQNLSRKGSISEKVSPLPYRLTISPDRSKFNVPVPGRTTEIELTLQMIDVKTGRNVARTGEVYISVEIDKIVFPEVIKLNDRGYARLKAVVKPFQTPGLGAW